MASALPACAGVFARAHCPHPRLFEEEYKRDGVDAARMAPAVAAELLVLPEAPFRCLTCWLCALLCLPSISIRSPGAIGTEAPRCFPHCCPHHVERSYCGSSLEVVLRVGPESDVVQDSRALGEPFDVANVFVFARFEIVDGKPLSGAFSLCYLRSVSQSEMNPEASWIEGVRQTATDRQQHSQQLHGRQPPSHPSSSEGNAPATFVLNGQAFAKWYYHWESGANKVQRATKHALKAYVFYQTQEGEAPDPVQAISPSESAVQRGSTRDGTLALLCVVTSPPFTVVSYRRAPLEACAGPGALGMDVAVSLVPHYATDTAHPVDSRLRRLVQHQISQAFQEYNHHQQHQQDPRSGSSGSFDPFGAPRSLDEQDEGRVGSGDRGKYGRYRQLQEREGLRFRLLTPEDAALSGSSLLGQSQPQETRLVFDSTRRRNDHPPWRDTSMEEEEAEDDCDQDDFRDEAVPQPLTPRGWMPPSASGYEVKVSGPVGTPPSTTDPVRQAERAANIALLRIKQQQQQLDNHPRELQQLTDLAIVHFFVSRITANSIKSLANLEVVFTIAISQHWRYASGGATDLARLLLSVAMVKFGKRPQGATGSRSNTAGPLADAKLEELMLVLAEVCVWAFSPESVELVQSLLTACHPLLLESLQSSGSSESEEDGQELRTAFLECAGRCWSALDGFLRTPRATQTTIRSVRELSDAVLGVVYSCPELEELRSGLRAMLQRPTVVLEDSKENTGLDALFGSVTPRCNLTGWRGFVAQVREGYLRDQSSGRAPPQTPMQGGQGRTPAGAASTTLTAQDAPSMWTSCLALSQLLHLKIAVAGDPLHTLYVRAEPSVLSPDNAWLRLICDGRVRVAPVAPNGLTSLMGGASCGFGGDYVAYRLEPQDPTLDSVCVEFYWWPVGKTQGEDQRRLAAYRSVMTLKTAAGSALMEGRMDLERSFVERQTIDAAEVPELELWAPTERVQAVAGWKSWLSIEGVYARRYC
ncbi:hypothetical protein PHYPSEUDO_006706 [Phytophthora pseudosyringae]|uniref:Uncharacterized protein n=1 Tax=Phytophthora pseudosyringae TaxID=221518 RepID=A0A8T1VIG6_9STRA|nr:hypothetical protein PHYPSEUDO_006706 [Phytophthora pseudosyringae]